MRKWIVLAIAAATLAACSKKASQSVAKQAVPEEPEGFSVTRWSPRTELFMEYPALIAGQTGRFAVHLTRLNNFKPLRAGKVEVQLASADGVQRFSADGPSRPGIFGVDVKPAKAGNYTMTVELRSAEANDSHDHRNGGGFSRRGRRHEASRGRGKGRNYLLLEGAAVVAGFRHRAGWTADRPRERRGAGRSTSARRQPRRRDRSPRRPAGRGCHDPDWAYHIEGTGGRAHRSAHQCTCRSALAAVGQSRGGELAAIRNPRP